MRKLKHSKYKNTGILFELLVRQISTDTLNNRDSKATYTIREHFGKSTELAKELKLYKALVEESFSSEYKASEFVNIILNERKKLNETTLNKQKYNLIKAIKKNFVLVPVIASVLFGTFTGVKYIVNLTDTINQSEVHIVNLERDLTMAQDKIAEMNTRLSSAEATWQMAENLYRTLADQVREHSYDIKDLNR